MSGRARPDGRGAQPQQPPPQQPAPGAPPPDVALAPTAARPPTLIADQMRATSACPCGQVTGRASSVTLRRTSKVVWQSRQR